LWSVKIPVVFVVIDNKPHLTEKGINYLSKLSEKVVVVTTNNSHPAKSASGILENIEILQYEQKIDFVDMFKKLKTQFGAERVTIQSGGALNSEFLKLGLIDNLSIVVAPILIGGKNTPSLIDGESLHVVEDLQNIRALKLENVDVLENSYLHLKYKVIN